MKRSKFVFVVEYAILVVLILYGVNRLLFFVSYEKIEYNVFENMARMGNVEKVVIGVEKIYIYEKPEEKTSSKVLYTNRIPQDKEDILEKIKDYGIQKYEGEENKNDTILEIFINWIIPIILFGAVGKFVIDSVDRKVNGEALDVGKSNAKIYAEKDLKVRFTDVAGQEEAKESLREVVGFLNNPDRYKDIGAKVPKGVLLVGPPGTGKTLMAKAVAGEAEVPFFSMSGAEFVQMFVGLGAAKVRDLFAQAQKKSPCIVFIDEIDAIGKKRSSGSVEGNEEREQTLNQLLTEMDGFDSGKRVVILAATNRPEILDKALLRAGRFDRRIVMGRPDLKGRVDILKVHMAGVKRVGELDLQKIARMTSGVVGADLANIVNESALGAIRREKNQVDQKDIESAVEEVVVGKKKRVIISEDEKRTRAYHQLGHALAESILDTEKSIHKITIIPRDRGLVNKERVEEGRIFSSREMHDRIVCELSGRAAEEVLTQKKTTASLEDIKRATRIARNMISRYGMNELFDMAYLEDTEGEYLGDDIIKLCSDRTEYEIDREVISTIKSCHKEAQELMEKYRDVLLRAGEVLMERETMSRREFLRILKQYED